jgi:hypothetical protein
MKEKITNYGLTALKYLVAMEVYLVKIAQDKPHIATLL